MLLDPCSTMLGHKAALIWWLTITSIVSGLTGHPARFYFSIASRRLLSPHRHDVLVFPSNFRPFSFSTRVYVDPATQTFYLPTYPPYCFYIYFALFRSSVRCPAGHFQSSQDFNKEARYGQPGAFRNNLCDFYRNDTVYFPAIAAA